MLKARQQSVANEKGFLKNAGEDQIFKKQF